MTEEDPLLSVRGLEKHFPVTKGLLAREVGRVRAVDGVDFDLRRGEALGIVGESGCGKSTAARAMLGLTEPTGGEVWFDGQDVTTFSRGERKRFRRRVQMVFQDPTSSFDPRMTIGESVAEPMVAHGMDDAERRRERAGDLLDVVGLSREERDRYPHELSGGEKQRAALARALSLNPDVLVLDEPVSALDVSVQAEILALVDDLQDAFDLGIVCISHDMSVVRQLCDRVAVMYVGELVERGPTEALFEDPAHPYTRSLLSAIPRPDPHDRLENAGLSGDVPDPADPPTGCRFHTRCPAVVPPEDVDFDAETFRAAFDLRVDLRDGRVSTDRFQEADGSVDAAVREAYDLPAELPDPAAESVLAAAVEAIREGDRERAAERLGETIRSPCEGETPGRHETADRLVACHHYGPDGERALPAATNAAAAEAEREAPGGD